MAADAEEVHLAFPRAVYEDLQCVLFPEKGHPFYGMGERGAFCVLSKSTGTQRTTYIVENVIEPESEDDLRAPDISSGDEDSGFLQSLLRETDIDIRSTDNYELGYEFSEEYHERAVQQAQECGGGLLRVHTHPGGVRPSPVDTASAKRVYEHDRDRLPLGAPFGAAITNKRGKWSARVYEPDADGNTTVTSTSCTRIVGPNREGAALRKLPTRNGTHGDRASRVDLNQQDSTVQLWGEDGQEVLADFTVGLVGCGGVGSILAEHLARLGIGELVFVDFDRLKESNLNRAQGADRIDVRQERLKTAVAERVARAAATADGFETRIVDGSVVEEDPEYAAVPALLDCDVVLSGVDAARPRQVLDHLARAHCIPVIDGGSKLHAEADGTLEPEAKAETAVSGPGWPCFECQRVWRPKDVQYERDHPAFRGERGYMEDGRDPDEEDRDPSVIGVNSIVAGLMQRRFLALTLDVAEGVVGTFRMKLWNGETNWSSQFGCQDSCSPPPVAIGDRHNLPTGTGWAMRYERGDIPMPETKVADNAADLLDNDLTK